MTIEEYEDLLSRTPYKINKILYGKDVAKATLYPDTEMQTGT
jgi:hypothetical protein